MKPKILIVRTDRMGDVLLSTPAIRAVRRAVPNAHIAVMVRPYTADIVRDNPDIDEVIVYDKEAREKGIWGNFRFAVRLFLKRFDTALILHSSNRSVLIPFLAGIRLRAGYARRLGFLLSHPLPPLKNKGDRHEIVYSLDVLEKAGFPVGDTPLRPVFNVNARDRETAKRLLEKKGVRPDDTIVCIHAGASCPSRWWPLSRFRDVARHFIREKRCVAVVIGGNAEVERMEELACGLGPKLLNFTGMLTIGETAAVIERSAV
ncbi:MAG TPA: glycosyltransferase family 9 protein, partial [bacterium]|nr:glycosyltransferase family 9 protein [bacterium]